VTVIKHADRKCASIIRNVCQPSTDILRGCPLTFGHSCLMKVHVDLVSLHLFVFELEARAGWTERQTDGRTYRHDP